MTLSMSHYFLFLDILLFVLAVCSALCNGFILGVIATHAALRKNDALYLIVALCIADFLLATTLIPYIVLLLSGWRENTAEIDYPPLTILILNLPVVLEIKVNNILTLAIAVDRVYAVYWPITYKVRRKSLYILGSILIGCSWATFDGTFLMTSTNFTSHPGCAAAGCFTDRPFRNYRGTSDMCINLVAMITTTILLLKLRQLSSAVRSATVSSLVIPNKDHSDQGRKESRRTIVVADGERNKFRHANRIVASILIISGICIFLPSVFSGLGEIFQLPAFQKAGPFVAVGLLLSGTLNAIVYGLNHSDVRQVIRGLRRKTSGLRLIPASFTPSRT